MQECRTTIVNRLGLHARAASKFVAVASRYGCSVRVRKDTDWVDGKSIMAVMMLAAGKGCELELQTDGEDEAAAISSLLELIEDCFGEGG